MRFQKNEPIGLFSSDGRLSFLTEMGDPLQFLAQRIDFEFFRPPLMKILYGTYSGRRGGRPPFDPVMMFKVLVLQRLYNLSDDAVEYQINDRLSFMRFLGLDFASRVPDARTIWLFRDQLQKKVGTSITNAPIESTRKNASICVPNAANGSRVRNEAGPKRLRRPMRCGVWTLPATC